MRLPAHILGARTAGKLSIGSFNFCNGRQVLFPNKIHKVKNVLTHGKRVQRLWVKICQMFSKPDEAGRKGQWGGGVSVGKGLTWE